MHVPYAVTDGRPLRFDPPPVTLHCTCGDTFEHPTRAGAERLHAEHRAEQRDPDAHEAVAF